MRSRCGHADRAAPGSGEFREQECHERNCVPIAERARQPREPGLQGTLGNARASGEATRSARMKKLKNESALFKAALLAAIQYAAKRGAAGFEPGDCASETLRHVSRCLVHDKPMPPLPESHV